MINDLISYPNSLIKDSEDLGFKESMGGLKNISSCVVGNCWLAEAFTKITYSMFLGSTLFVSFSLLAGKLFCLIYLLIYLFHILYILLYLRFLPHIYSGVPNKYRYGTLSDILV